MEENVFLPRSWAGWEIAGWIGGGSYGDVYRTVSDQADTEGKKEAAVKIIHIPGNAAEAAAVAHDFPDPEDQKRYYEDLATHLSQEMQAMAFLQGHPNAVTLQDCQIEHVEGSLEWTIFIRMELLTPLEEYRIDHEMDEAAVLRLGLDLCQVLEACEAGSIIHRDIKTENILVSGDGTFKLGDFGLARQMDLASGSLSMKGSFTYMSPEVYHGQPYDFRADQYSLGIVLYRLLNRNRDPFTDPSASLVYYKDREESLQRRMRGEPLPPPAEAGEDLACVILKACAYQPDERYSHIADMKHDLMICAGMKKGKIRKTSQKAKKRKPWIFALGAAAVVAVLALVLVFSGILPDRFSPGGSASATYVDSGSCGADLSYRLSEEGTLEIYGTGMMNSYEILHPSPWRWQDNITEVIIEEGVTGIGAYAFRMNTEIVNIRLPSTLEYIGDHAFDQCWDLSAVTIPAGVGYVGDGLFSNCINLKTVTVDPDNQVYDSRSYCNAVIETASNTLVVGCSTTRIPDSVTTIGAYAFESCVAMSEIYIPPTVVRIDETAFDRCKDLTILGAAGSAAEQFAKEQGFTFAEKNSP